MNRILFSLIVMLLTFVSCKTNRTINRKKQGIWIESVNLENITYQSKGRFKNNEETGKWQYFENGKKLRKEIYKKNYTIKTLYHPNGKIASKGRTKTNSDSKMLHWFYDGIWKFYNEKGQLIRIKIYQNSDLISDQEKPIKK